MLADSGVGGDRIRAEEFTGFNLKEIHSVAGHTWKRPILIATIVLGVIAAVILHAGAAISISRNGFGGFLAENRISYVMIGLLLVLVIFKLEHFLWFRQRKK